jgi:hypothetical protein
MNDTNRSFLLLPKTSGEGETFDFSGSALINLSLVRKAEVVSAHELKLWYSGNHIEVIQGTAAPMVLELLLNRSVMLTGHPFTFPDDEPQSQQLPLLKDPDPAT